jgi:hypothetical protein
MEHIGKCGWTKKWVRIFLNLILQIRRVRVTKERVNIEEREEEHL